MSEKYVKIGNLSISENLLNFVNNEVLPGTGISQQRYWSGFDEIVHQLAPKNRDLIDIRRKLQLEIDRWHLNNKKKNLTQKNTKNF